MNLEVKNISKSYGKKKILENLSFELQPGVYGLLGANGAGKSTLFRLICGVAMADEGYIKYDGKLILEDRPLFYDDLGFLPQDFNYYSNFTGLDFLGYMGILKGIPQKIVNEKCLKMLSFVGLSEEANKKIKSYSGGMKQRLGIAQALLNDPKVLILDEPTVGLDPKERVRFRNLISSLSDDKIIILSTHIVSDVEYIADEVLILKQGKLIDRGTVPFLVKEIEDKVWECFISENEVINFNNSYVVSNQKQVEGGAIFRIVAEKQPQLDAKQVSPTLEDLYLYYFKEIN